MKIDATDYVKYVEAKQTYAISQWLKENIEPHVQGGGIVTVTNLPGGDAYWDMSRLNYLYQNLDNLDKLWKKYLE